MFVQTKPLFPIRSVLNHRNRRQDRLDTRRTNDEWADDEGQPTAVLVEHRDEVFARIATDLAEAGLRVIRAKSAIGALRRCARCEPSFVLANIDLPDQSGWLLTAKMRLVDPDVPVWLYQPHSSPYHAGTAKYLDVDEVLDYGGDLLGLSDTIRALLDGVVRDSPCRRCRERQTQAQCHLLCTRTS